MAVTYLLVGAMVLAQAWRWGVARLAAREVRGELTRRQRLVVSVVWVFGCLLCWPLTMLLDEDAADDSEDA